MGTKWGKRKLKMGILEENREFREDKIIFSISNIDSNFATSFKWINLLRQFVKTNANNRLLFIK